MTRTIEGFTASVCRNSHEQVVCGLLQFDAIPELQGVRLIESATLASRNLTLLTDAGEFRFPNLHQAVVTALHMSPLVVLDHTRGFERQIAVNHA